MLPFKYLAPFAPIFIGGAFALLSSAPMSLAIVFAVTLAIALGYVMHLQDVVEEERKNVAKANNNFSLMARTADDEAQQRKLALAMVQTLQVANRELTEHACALRAARKLDQATIEGLRAQQPWRMPPDVPPKPKAPNEPAPAWRNVAAKLESAGLLGKTLLPNGDVFAGTPRWYLVVGTIKGCGLKVYGMTDVCKANGSTWKTVATTAEAPKKDSFFVNDSLSVRVDKNGTVYGHASTLTELPVAIYRVANELRLQNVPPPKKSEAKPN